MPPGADPLSLLPLEWHFPAQGPVFTWADIPFAIHTGQHALCQLDQLPAKAQIIACRAQEGSQDEVIGDTGVCDAWE